jgi:hypothetical protein
MLMNWQTVGRVVKVLFLCGLGVYQVGMALFYSTHGVRFASQTPEVSPPTSAMYGALSGVWGIGGMITVFLSSIILQQELRIRRLEQAVERASAQEQTQASSRE